MGNDIADIQYIKGVGPKLGALLKKKNIHTALDFLYTFPRTYEDRRSLPTISQLEPGKTQLFLGAVKVTQERKIKKGLSLFKAHLGDATGTIACVWFNQPFLKNSITAGKQLVVKAKIERSHFDYGYSASVIEYEIIQKFEPKIVPIYQLSAGLYQATMRNIAKEVLKKVPYIIDPLPEYIQKKYQLVPIREAIKEMHLPSSPTAFELSRQRIIFDEFFYFQLSLSKNRKQVKQANISPLKTSGPLIETYLKSLPYEFTNDQKKAIQDIANNVSGTLRMNRLLQGDVGAGKTDVAIMALLMGVESQKKGALLAPTDILSEQHYIKISKRLEALNVPVYLLRGKTGIRERRKIYAALESDEPLVLIGTHAILEEKVAIKRLGMAIIDEQHRFGVLQRAALSEKGEGCHCLFMTATPIPRSLLLSCFGDLEKSVIKQLPPGRIPPKTMFFKENKLPQVYDFCKKQLVEGRQVFVVYPLVEESEKLDLKSATEGAAQLEKVFEGYKVGLIHGKMKQQEKSQIMQSFKEKSIHILVSTTVIEVGIDVPNATIMIIRHAERFGLSQLHQLRGRIGRGGNASFCFLVAEPKSDASHKRIKAMLDTTDGFELAEVDLKLRGPGDILGTRQSGLPEFKLASLLHDEPLLKQAQDVVKQILDSDPNLADPAHKSLSQALSKKYHVTFSRMS